MSGKFINYAGPGLWANKSATSKQVRIAYYRQDDGSVRLGAESAYNMSRLPGTAVVSAEEFAERPTDAYNDLVEAKWALHKCGWRIR